MREATLQVATVDAIEEKETGTQEGLDQETEVLQGLNVLTTPVETWIRKIEEETRDLAHHQPDQDLPLWLKINHQKHRLLRKMVSQVSKMIRREATLNNKIKR